MRIANPNTRGVSGLCLEVNDLAVSKYVAGREKDLEFTRELAKQGMTDSRVLIARVDQTELPAEILELVRARIRRDFTGNKRRT